MITIRQVNLFTCLAKNVFEKKEINKGKSQLIIDTKRDSGGPKYLLAQHQRQSSGPAQEAVAEPIILVLAKHTKITKYKILSSIPLTWLVYVKLIKLR